MGAEVSGALWIIAMAMLSLVGYLLKGSVDKGTKVNQEQLGELVEIKKAVTTTHNEVVVLATTVKEHGELHKQHIANFGRLGIPHGGTGSAGSAP